MTATPGHPAPEPGQREYLDQVLRLTPLGQSARIVMLRNRYRNARNACSTDGRGTAAEHGERRAALVRRLPQIRGDFWSLPTAETARLLAGLDAAGFPDIELLRRRLEIIAGARPRIEALAAQPTCDGPSLEMIRELLVLPPAEAAAAKLRLEDALAAPGRHRNAVRVLSLLKDQVPEAYGVERTWFESIRTSAPGHWAHDPQHGIPPATTRGCEPRKRLYSVARSIPLGALLVAFVTFMLTAQAYPLRKSESNPTSLYAILRRAIKEAPKRDSVATTRPRPPSAQGEIAPPRAAQASTPAEADHERIERERREARVREAWEVLTRPRAAPARPPEDPILTMQRMRDQRRAAEDKSDERIRAAIESRTRATLDDLDARVYRPREPITLPQLPSPRAPAADAPR